MRSTTASLYRVSTVTLTILATLNLQILAQESSGQEQEELLRLSCLVYDDMSFYDLRGLQNDKSDYKYEVAKANGETHFYNFNMCQYTNGYCTGNRKVFGYKEDKAGTCNSLTNGNLQNLTSTVEEDLDSGERYVQMKYLGGQECFQAETGVDNYSMTINLRCNSDGKKEDQLLVEGVNTKSKCHPVITASHKIACPVFSVTTFSRFFIDRPYILGPLAIVFGLMVAFAGRKFFPWTIAVIGCLIGGGITILLFSMSDILDSIKSSQSEETSGLELAMTITVAVIIGVFVGFILQKMLNIGAAILGAVGGFFIGVAAYNLLFFYLKSQFLLTAMSVLGSITMAFLSFRQYDNIVIFGTAFVGSYSFTRGVSLFIGNFPNEIQFFKNLLEGEVENSSWEVYFYLSTFVLLFVLGVVYQRRQRAKDAQFNYVRF
eukprot:403341764